MSNETYTLEVHALKTPSIADADHAQSVIAAAGATTDIDALHRIAIKWNKVYGYELLCVVRSLPY